MAKTIKVERVPKKQRKDGDSIDELLTTLCYYYQQYTFSEAKKLPYKRVTMMLRVANKIEAIRMRALANIVAAPHFDSGKGVSKLIEHYTAVIDGED